MVTTYLAKGDRRPSLGIRRIRPYPASLPILKGSHRPRRPLRESQSPR